MQNRTYYSYSRLWCYLKDPQEYYIKYVEKDPVKVAALYPISSKMLLGTIFSDAYAGRKISEKDEKLKYDWKKALINPGKYYKRLPPGVTTFTSDYLRAMELALSSKNLMRAKPKYCEQSIKVESTICPLLAKNDAFIEDKMMVIENKYGAFWTQQRADEDDQVSFYCYVVYLKYGVIPLLRLQSGNSKTGEVRTFITTRTKRQFKLLEDKILTAYNGIKNEIYESQAIF